MKPLAFLSLFALLLFSCQQTPEATQPLLQEEQAYEFELTFEDQFDGDTLNLDKWNYEREGIQRAGFWTKDAVSVRDGNLVMAARYQEEKKRFITGDISTRQSFKQTFGYWEARIQLQKAEGFWSAFWLMPFDHIKPGDKPEKGLEIDIFEKTTPSNDVVYSTVHWGGYGKTHRKAWTSYKVKNICKGWHTFGLLWDEDSYTFFIDGHKVAHMTKDSEVLKGSSNFAIDKKIKTRSGVPICQAPLYPRLSCAYGSFDDNGKIKRAWGEGGKPPADDIDDEWLVDYVRVFKLVEKSTQNSH